MSYLYVLCVVCSEGISAKYENGVLRVCVPKSQKTDTQRAIKVD